MYTYYNMSHMIWIITYTIHYADPNGTGELKSKVLECAHFNPRHTAKNLEADINRIRDDFEIEKKLVHLCADNAKAQQNACKGMFFFWIICSEFRSFEYLCSL